MAETGGWFARRFHYIYLYPWEFFRESVVTVLLGVALAVVGVVVLQSGGDIITGVLLLWVSYTAFITAIIMLIFSFFQIDWEDSADVMSR